MVRWASWGLWLSQRPRKEFIIANIISLCCANLLTERAEATEEPQKAVARLRFVATPCVGRQIVSFSNSYPPEAPIEQAERTEHNASYSQGSSHVPTRTNKTRVSTWPKQVSMRNVFAENFKKAKVLHWHQIIGNQLLNNIQCTGERFLNWFNQSIKLY